MSVSPTKIRLPSTGKGYELREQIGQGSCASVFRAWCEEFKEEVAIKVVDLEWLQASLDDIAREIQVMSLASHPNVVPFSTAFVEGADLWIVMPLLTGGSVLSLMNCAFPEGLPEDCAVYVLWCVLRALEYFHGHGQMHRDVKAANLMLDRQGHVMLSDYGVMGWMIEGGWDRKHRQTFVGTPCWMAPEVMEQSTGYDYKADIWSLGITAIELGQGRAPYASCLPMKVLYLTLQNPPPTLTGPASERFSDKFKAFVARCLQRNPTERPTARQLLADPLFAGNVPKPDLLEETIAKLPPIGSRGGSQKQLYRQLQKVSQPHRSGVHDLTSQGFGWDFEDERTDQKPPRGASSTDVGSGKAIQSSRVNVSASDGLPESSAKSAMNGSASASSTGANLSSSSLPPVDKAPLQSNARSQHSAWQGLQNELKAANPMSKGSSAAMSPNDSNDGMHVFPSSSNANMAAANPVAPVGMLKRGRYLVSDVTQPRKVNGKIEGFLESSDVEQSSSGPGGSGGHSALSTTSFAAPQAVTPPSSAAPALNISVHPEQGKSAEQLPSSSSAEKNIAERSTSALPGQQQKPHDLGTFPARVINVPSSRSTVSPSGQGAVPIVTVGAPPVVLPPSSSTASLETHADRASTSAENASHPPSASHMPHNEAGDGHARDVHVTEKRAPVASAGETATRVGQATEGTYGVERMQGSGAQGSGMVSPLPQGQKGAEEPQNCASGSVSQSNPTSQVESDPARAATRPTSFLTPGGHQTPDVNAPANVPSAALGNLSGKLPAASAEQPGIHVLPSVPAHVSSATPFTGPANSNSSVAMHGVSPKSFNGTTAAPKRKSRFEVKDVPVPASRPPVSHPLPSSSSAEAVGAVPSAAPPAGVVTAGIPTTPKVKSRFEVKDVDQRSRPVNLPTAPVPMGGMADPQPGTSAPSRQGTPVIPIQADVYSIPSRLAARQSLSLLTELTHTIHALVQENDALKMEVAALHGRAHGSIRSGGIGGPRASSVNDMDVYRGSPLSTMHPHGLSPNYSSSSAWMRSHAYVPEELRVYSEQRSALQSPPAPAQQSGYEQQPVYQHVAPLHPYQLGHGMQPPVSMAQPRAVPLHQHIPQVYPPGAYMQYQPVHAPLMHHEQRVQQDAMWRQRAPDYRVQAAPDYHGQGGPDQRGQGNGSARHQPPRAYAADAAWGVPARSPEYIDNATSHLEHSRGPIPTTQDSQSGMGSIPELTNASPASLAAHVPSQNEQLLSSGEPALPSGVALGLQHVASESGISKHRLATGVQLQTVPSRSVGIHVPSGHSLVDQEALSQRP